MDDFFLKLGFKDITKEKPISFSECFIVTFDYPYKFSKRYIINRIGYTIVVLVGKDNYATYYCIQLYALNYRDSYSDIIPTKVFEDAFNMVLSKMISLYQDKVKNSIDIYGTTNDCDHYYKTWNDETDE
jgi:hypothetical protein